MYENGEVSSGMMFTISVIKVSHLQSIGFTFVAENKEPLGFSLKRNSS
jgi:hypothetical protein